MGEMQKKIFTNKDLSDITKTNSKSAIADLAGDDEQMDVRGLRNKIKILEEELQHAQELIESKNRQLYRMRDQNDEDVMLK